MEYKYSPRGSARKECRNKLLFHLASDHTSTGIPLTDALDAIARVDKCDEMPLPSFINTFLETRVNRVRRLAIPPVTKENPDVHNAIVAINA